jgi:hypothetical protein
MLGGLEHSRLLAKDGKCSVFKDLLNQQSRIHVCACLLVLESEICLFSKLEPTLQIGNQQNWLVRCRNAQQVLGGLEQMLVGLES